MATREFLEDVKGNLLECTICSKELQNPKSLNCLHSFCLACLEDRVKEGKLTCPTCWKSHNIPEGGLQKLPLNTFFENLIKTKEKFIERDQMICVCGTYGQAKCYCQDCRHYLCITCSDHHKIFPVLAKHKLRAVEDIKPMSQQDFALLHSPLCSIHDKPLEFYCINADCKIPTCITCAFMDHKEWEGKHKSITITEAFQKFQKTAMKLRDDANHYRDILKEGLRAVLQNDTKLEKSKETSLRDIENLVQEIVKKIIEKGDEMKNEVETIYKKKKNVNNKQMDELRITISDVSTKLSYLNQLLKSDEATAMQSSEMVITALKERIKEIPKTEPKDNGQIYFYINKHEMSLLQQHCDIGTVTQMMAVDSLELREGKDVTQGQPIVVNVIKKEGCDIGSNQLKATWTHPTGEINVTQVEKDNSGNHIVTGRCTSPGVCRLDVSVDGELIKQSPMTFKVEKEGLVNTIKINQEIVSDVVMGEFNCLRVSCRTEDIFRYKQSGEYVDKITLPVGVKVNRMYKMKNAIAFSDSDSKCITFITMDGQVIKSIGKGELKNPKGIHVDETSNTVYVADKNNSHVFDIDSGKKMKTLQSGCSISDVTMTKGGDVIALRDPKSLLVYYNVGHYWLDGFILQVHDNRGVFIKNLVKADKMWKPCGIVVDADDNIIISSEHKLQLFSSDGNFIKRIDKDEDEIKNPCGLSIISYHPRSVAVANKGNNTIKIFNY
ncbi:tripartite motif-containing protein 2-like [Anneissia japonica]|uniref:tripartite motif-containing protein 2-like n=1 Tax=Anneissia japonica TaxID=1529436 RepID=UPI001425AD24|nr:tripartite motif-containing protein 2-like [Anneissia japonica]